MRYSFFTLKKSASANALTEYILPVAIIGIVVIMAVTQLVPGLSARVKSSNNGAPLTVGSNQMLVRSMGSNPYTQSLQIQMADGSVLTLNEYPRDIQNLLETVGSNGTTDILAANLQSIAQQMLAQGKLSEEQYNQLIDLANQGHNLGIMEGLLEDAAIRSNGDKNAFKLMPMTYKGQQHTTASLHTTLSETIGNLENTISAQQIDPETKRIFGLYETVTGDNEDKGKPIFYGRDLYNFMNSYMSASRQGALNDPTVQKVVRDLAMQIKTISVQTAAAAYYSFDESNTELRLEDFSKNVASNVTHQNSAQICQNGNGTEENGIHCSQ